MRRSTACGLAMGGSIACLAVEGAIWGTWQVFATLGVLLILVVPAFFVSPKHDPRDRIWLISLLFMLTGWLRRKGRHLLLGTGGSDGDESPGECPPPSVDPFGGGTKAASSPLLLGPGPILPEDPPTGSGSRESIADLVR
jgi:hypothetical protein